MRGRTPHTLRRWLVPDPLSEKYLGLSPYAYCAGNPVSKIDIDGKRIVFAKGVSEEFKARFKETIDFMNERGTSYNAAELHKSDVVYYIDELANAPLGTNGLPHRSSYTSVSKNGEGGTLYWDPYQVVFNTKSNISWSPTTSLAHELGHLVRYDRAVHGGMGKLDEFLQSTLSGSDEQFETLEERIIITTTEQYAARRHGDILSEQVTRSNHEGVPVPAPQEGWQSMSPEEISRYVYYILDLNDIK